ncbi:hypothetical protein QZM22_30690 [Burkholderia oklahomensis]|uniref:hypothetical protein n=1 Tax=Burkholderia oklahomensis TaxID=342113 RepID=UPI00264CA5EB|nr:hypothetical protein [Burkholderia oklahomensis]MDN7676728.1 hypothetical protein [Burkholderia oklahomensis]
MNQKFTIGLLAVACLMSASSAMAARDWTEWNHPYWAAGHPWRAHDNARINHQDWRINREFREGEIGWQQAAAEHQAVHSILAEERAYAWSNGTGRLNGWQQQQITRQLNATSWQIGR